MANAEKPAVSFEVDDVCARFSAVYTGAISDVLDQIGFRHQVLPWEIQGLTIEHRVAGVAMPVEGQPTESQDPEEIFVPVLKMLGDLKPGDVIIRSEERRVGKECRYRWWT